MLSTMTIERLNFRELLLIKKKLMSWDATALTEAKKHKH
jgi:hypothetical protein